MKSLVGGGWQTKFNVLGPFGPDLGSDLDLTWDLDLDLSLTIAKSNREQTPTSNIKRLHDVCVSVCQI